jgi:hypothetical protein
MARFPRTLDQALSDLASTGRRDRATALTIPALEPIGRELLNEELNTELDGNGQAIADNQHYLEQLNQDLVTLDQDLSNASDSLIGLQQDLGNLDTALANTTQDLEQQINEAAVSLITDDRISPDSLTVWPFTQGSIPTGALAPGSVGANDIANFSIAVTKLKSTRHHLY